MGGTEGGLLRRNFAAVCRRIYWLDAFSADVASGKHWRQLSQKPVYEYKSFDKSWPARTFRSWAGAGLLSRLLFSLSVEFPGLNVSGGCQRAGTCRDAELDMNLLFLQRRYVVDDTRVCACTDLATVASPFNRVPLEA